MPKLCSNNKKLRRCLMQCNLCSNNYKEGIIFSPRSSKYLCLFNSLGIRELEKN